MPCTPRPLARAQVGHSRPKWSQIEAKLIKLVAQIVAKTRPKLDYLGKAMRDWRAGRQSRQLPGSTGVKPITLFGIRSVRGAGGPNISPKNTQQMAPRRTSRRARTADLPNKCSTITARDDIRALCVHKQRRLILATAGNRPFLAGPNRPKLAEIGPRFALIGQIAAESPACAWKHQETIFGGSLQTICSTISELAPCGLREGGALWWVLFGHFFGPHAAR